MTKMKYIWIILIVVILLYVAATIWVAGRDTELLLAPKTEQLAPIPYSEINWSQIEIETEDTTKLVGWEIYAPETDTADLWLIHFHDRDETVQDNLTQYLQLRNMGFNILAVDYRGFGESEGTPTEDKLYSDAKAIYDLLRYKRDIASRSIVLYGVSLGAAVAVDLAVEVNAGALVLISGFTSAPDLLQSWYPYLPVKPLIGTGMASIEKITQINTPKFFAYSSTCGCIPERHTRDLYEAAPPKYRTYLELTDDSLTGFNHDFYANLYDSLSRKAWLDLQPPKLPLADTLAAIIKQGRVEEAIRWYRELQMNQPDRFDFGEYQLDYLGNRLLKDNHPREAMEILKLNASVYPDSYHAYYSLGRAYHAVEDERNALKNLRKSLELKPGNPKAANLLRQIERR